MHNGSTELGACPHSALQSGFSAFRDVDAFLFRQLGMRFREGSEK